ncbi:MAG: hypothetical protein WD029_08745, partial [Microthrixaceae bacterium]
AFFAGAFLAGAALAAAFLAGAALATAFFAGAAFFEVVADLLVTISSASSTIHGTSVHTEE